MADSDYKFLEGKHMMAGSSQKKSMTELVAAAQAGDSEAQNSLAMLHELGLIPNAQVNEAMQWYGKAVKSGDPQAAIALARLQEQAIPKPDGKIIEALYKVAAKQGYRSPHVRRNEVFAKENRPTVMVVDDTESYRKSATALLEKNGYKVFASPDAFQALRYIENGNVVDLVLSDLEMPEMSGVEMLQLIRQRYRRTDLPVIMVTSSRDVELLKKAKSYGLQGWILKPYEANMLLQTVQKTLSTKKAS